MALYRYFQPVDSLPDLRGQISREINHATIQDANKAVRDALKKSKSRGKYWKFKYALGIYWGCGLQAGTHENKNH